MLCCVSDINLTSREFENLALQMLEECYKTDQNKAMEMITRKSQQFNDLTCLEVAVNSNHLEFVAHSCVQVLLNDVWTGELVEKDDVSIYHFLLAIVFPPYLTTFNFRNARKEKKNVVSIVDETSEQQFNSAPSFQMVETGKHENQTK